MMILNKADLDGPAESPYDSKAETSSHINEVQWCLKQMRDQLYLRGEVHDYSKLKAPEKEIFDKVTPELQGLTYGSDEYKKALAGMGVALRHHYEVNSHHPEHFENGIDGMTLLDVLEMFCDW